MTKKLFTSATLRAGVALSLLGAAACSPAGQSGAGQNGQADASLPQLGKASLPDVLAALTTEEKVKLVVGRGFYPSGFPEGMLPPGDPGDREVSEKVPGAAAPTPSRGWASRRSRFRMARRAGASTPGGARTRPKPTTPRPSQWLRCWPRAESLRQNQALTPGQSQTLTFTLKPANLISFNTASSSWVADANAASAHYGVKNCPKTARWSGFIAYGNLSYPGAGGRDARAT